MITPVNLQQRKLGNILQGSRLPAAPKSAGVWRLVHTCRRHRITPVRAGMCMCISSLRCRFLSSVLGGARVPWRFAILLRKASCSLEAENGGEIGDGHVGWEKNTSRVSTAVEFVVAGAATITNSRTVDAGTATDNRITNVSTMTGGCERSEKFASNKLFRSNERRICECATESLKMVNSPLVTGLIPLCIFR